MIVVNALGEQCPIPVVKASRALREMASPDTLEVLVEMDSSFFSDTVRGIEEQERKIAKQLDFVLGISAKVTLVEPKSLARSEGKAVRVIDKRKLHD